jgi:hypothetical protein
MFVQICENFFDNVCLISKNESELFFIVGIQFYFSKIEVFIVKNNNNPKEIQFLSEFEFD